MTEIKQVLRGRIMRFPNVALSEIARPVTRPVSVLPGVSYRTIGVKWWGEGAYEREAIDGTQTAAKTLSIVCEGDLIINKIWVRHGSTAIASKAVDGCAASGEFPTFELDRTKVLPRWIHWLTKSSDFWSKCDALSHGTSGKNRIKPELFLTIKIPLPSLSEQCRIVARIEELAARIEEARGLRRDAMEEAEAIMQIARRMYIGETVSADWVPLRNHIIEIENGWSPACENRPATGEEWGVLKVGAVSFGFYHEFENKALPPILRPKTEYEVHPGDFLMSRANTTSLVGACALVEQTRSKLMLSDKIFRFLFKENTPIDRRYLVNVLKSPALRSQIEHAASGTSSTMKNISKEKVLSLLIPTRNIDEQHRIVAYLDDLQSKVNSLKQLQSETSAELDALLPSILDKAFKGEL